MHSSSSSNHRVLRSTQQAYRQAEEFVRLGRCGETSHRSSDAPFMNTKTAGNGDSPPFGERVDALLAETPLPEELRQVYRVIARPDCEHVFGRWILMGLEQVASQYKIRVGHGQRRAVDFALQYEGLGHCQICSYDPQSDRVYYRYDGGSSAIEADLNAELANAYVPDGEKSTPLHPFAHWSNEAKASAADTHTH